MDPLSSFETAGGMAGRIAVRRLYAMRHAVMSRSVKQASVYVDERAFSETNRYARRSDRVTVWETLKSLSLAVRGIRPADYGTITANADCLVQHGYTRPLHTETHTQTHEVSVL